MERMKVLPEDDFLTEDEWEVAHSYLVFAFRKVAGNGALVPFRKQKAKTVSDSDIITLGSAGTLGANLV